MVLDVLGVLIAFVSVMLMLSLIVTVLVQLLQSLLRLRSRNLLHGVESLLETVMEDTDCDSKTLAETALDSARFIPKRTPKLLGRATRLLLNPACTWIEFDELVDKLDTKLTAPKKKKMSSRFERMEDYLKKRFLFHVRILTVVCAVVVAFLFQVSAPGLVRDLSAEPQLRARYVTAAERLLDEATTTMTSIRAYEDVSPEALRRLQERHPDLAEQIEQAAGVGSSRADIVSELSDIFAADLPAKREAIVQEYQLLLDQLFAGSARTALEQARRLTSELRRFDITPWAQGWAYYRTFDHWVGVIITAILLTLGAPFWFDRLRKLATLKDQLQPSST